VIAVVVAVVGLAVAACSGEEEGAAPTATVRAATTIAPGTGDDNERDDGRVELAGTSWRLVSLEDLEGVSATAAGDVPAVVTFDATDIEGYDGVDTATGTYELDGERITIELDEVSALGPSDDPGIEQLLFGLLVDVDRAELAGGDLVLHHGAGELHLEPIGGRTAG